MTAREVGEALRSRQEKLLNGLLRQGLDREQAEAFIHALVDIAESVEKIYGTMLPELMVALDQPSAVFKDKLWDIREEFRHIDYHLHDAKLTGL